LGEGDERRKKPLLSEKNKKVRKENSKGKKRIH